MLSNMLNLNLNGGTDGSKLRFNSRVNLLDFPKFGGIKGLNSINNVNQISKDLKFPWFADIRYVWNTPVLYRYPSIRNDVLGSFKVTSTIEDMAQATGTSYSNVASQAKNFYESIRASISRIYTRLLGYLMFKIFRRLMNRLLIVPAQLKTLKEAHDTGIPIVYLPLHRSHMDYQIITWVVWHFGCRIQYVAAGDNLNLSGFGWLLRATGAFFIKRNTETNDDSTRDILYRSVLNAYIIGLLKAGQSLEFFLEGTRLGKTLLPKNGLISNIVEAVESGELKDVYLVPVSINYDALVEGIFYHELMGVRKPKENVFNVFRVIFDSFKRINVCGNVAVDFAKPILLSEELKRIKETAITRQALDYSTNFNSYRELLPWDDQNLSHKTLIRATGYHQVYRAQCQKPIGLTSLLSILFLCKYRQQSVKMSDLIEALRALIDEIHDLSYEVVGWFIDESKPEDLIMNTIQYLEEALEIVEFEDNVLIKINDCHKSWITLSYHKNNAIAPFALISIASIVFHLKSTKETPIDHIKQIQILSCLLRYEILICNPLESLEEKAKEAREFFTLNRNKFNQSFYSTITAPFLESLQYVAVYIYDHPIEYNTLSDGIFIQHLVTIMAADLTLQYQESANSDSVYNALKALRVLGAVNSKKIELLSEYLMDQIILQIQFYINHPVA